MRIKNQFGKRESRRSPAIIQGAYHMKNQIINKHSDIYGQLWGECNGRRVKWTYSVNMWFYYDTGEYITN